MLLTNTHPAECLRFQPVAPFVKYIHKTNVIGPCDKHVLNNVLLNACVAGAGVSGAAPVTLVSVQVGAPTVHGIIPE